jgi:hypothetical protein
VTATLTFILPEEADDLDLARKGSDWRIVVDDMDGYLRGRLKYEEGLHEKADKALDAARQRLHEFLSERGLSLW